MGSQAPPLSAGTGARYDPRPEGELAEEPDIVAARSRGGGGASSISSDTSRQQDLRSKTESSLDGGKDDATCIALSLNGFWRGSKTIFSSVLSVHGKQREERERAAVVL
jgi:hypothetical protein